MRNDSDTICGDNVTDILQSITPSSNQAYCKIIWISGVQPILDTDFNIIEIYVNSMLETKATITCSEYVKINVSLPQEM